MANTGQLTQGDALMLFQGGKSLAFATSHTLSMSAATIDVSSKDFGVWGTSLPGKITWELSTSNLYLQTDYDNLFDKMVAREPIDVVFANAANWDENGLDASTANWTPDTSTGLYRKGKAIITSLELSANNGEIASYNATFTGCSALEKTKPTK